MNQSDQPQPDAEGDDGIHSQQVRVSHLSARVPDKVSRGVFSTGLIVMTGGTEFILDFVQNVGRPHQIAARVVMPHAALPQFADALSKNLELYRQKFGDPPQLPRVETPKKPTIQEVYDDLKLPDELLSGSYANGVMISHNASEFILDFLTNFFPNSSISCRVFLSAPQVARILESLNGTYKQFQERIKQQRETPKIPPQDEEPPPEGDALPS